jgi:hypothetical protein
MGELSSAAPRWLEKLADAETRWMEAGEAMEAASPALRSR